MPTIKTVKPDGTGDYTTLQSWHTFAAAQGSADQWAECYAGNLGKLGFSAWSSTPDATHYPRIYAADGQRHNGVSPTSGAYISFSSSDLGGIYTSIGGGQPARIHIEGIAMQGSASISLPNSCIVMYDVDNLYIDGCVLALGSVASIEAYATTGTMNSYISNCLCMDSDTDFAVIVGTAASVL